MANYQKSATALTESAQLIGIFAETIRRQIIIALGNSGDGLNVTAITALVNISRPAVSHHLRLMREAGVIDMRSNGVEHIYYLTLAEPLKQLQSTFTTLTTDFEASQPK
ncbi:ArsR/SmtB family transcription factor [Lactiplantibacillus mudanjiangensis]|uniref:ArsR family transcriptional regulator [Lactobacillus sp.] n=1 Tax=Lactiplantibacillus mudanjiangensis TaxID=1296538 RepID=A0A660EAB4_9LACO|nr:metalloregulator ArsR/SmtB family transcription factor [Lactiplantibacillus mudanjiangensis]VDG17761.1 ArsR family transcriptional regulator [Lactobacillus sp.] [Lactiplantibacillus mudanjiangensis]VDG26293.1 ArsR family transcriptional regulator [Lactobacillus sp.] [Lactiplantibacillus mudanjiangensis]VDG29433.1 ArsR family transcriptional regulator [Lactobacillus sp.] [Lactiplantibacillus mudanjiangensis]VDG32547.1 ArsR family transcriptional regulator [Lactobacillus sp.] [Lactiplantibacil